MPEPRGIHKLINRTHETLVTCTRGEIMFLEFTKTVALRYPTTVDHRFCLFDLIFSDLSGLLHAYSGHDEMTGILFNLSPFSA